MPDKRSATFFGLRIPHFSSSNGDGQPPLGSSTPHSSDKRKENLRRALFCLAVGLLLVIADRVGHVENQSKLDTRKGPLEGVSLTLRLQRELANTAAGGSSKAASVTFLVSFRLTNNGNHSVFYPAYPGTSIPTGQVLYRASAVSAWSTLPGSTDGAFSLEQFTNRNLVWIEMPPGGWVEAEFLDPGEPRGEHAYAIKLKPERKADGVRIVSEPYLAFPN